RRARRRRISALVRAAAAGLAAERYAPDGPGNLRRAAGFRRPPPRRHRGRHDGGALGHAGVAVAMEEVSGRLRLPGGALGLVAALLSACAHYPPPPRPAHGNRADL